MRALLRGAVCHSCRHEVLRSFIAVSGVPMPRYSSALRPVFNSRTFSAIGSLRSDRPPVSQHPEINESPVEEKPNELQSDSSASSHIPWYLQEESPPTETRPVSGDHIPEIPENSPEILPTLLEYTYKDLGLDSLKLHDLRGLEIPAALGANVIMIIGTARSVKHLNVSADRLCRWLRSTYKLSPYADGLLGRNELKIKLRRKAKRARAASAAGAFIDEKDDGITTGWICVNAGVIDKNAPRAELSDIGFEGFGQVDTGTSVVVQIFTEEKRAETFERAEKKRLQDAQNNPPAASQSSATGSSPFGPSGQKRYLHSAQDLSPNTNTDGSSLSDVLAATSGSQMIRGKDMSTESLLKMLVNLPHESARNELGTGPEDRESTLFLQLLYASLPPSMAESEVTHLRLNLFSIAVSRQHPAYSKEELFSTFSGLLNDGHDLSDDLAFEVLAALLTPRVENFQQPSPYLPESDIELALQVLDRLSLRGSLISLQPLLLGSPPHKSALRSTNSKRWTDSQRQKLARLSKIVAAAEVPFDAPEARKLMVTLFRCEDYDGFWPTLKGARRTREDYAQLFQLHADLGDELRARDCLSAWVPMMAREQNPIVLQGPLVNSLMHCLLVADPNIHNRSEDASPSYFGEVWTRCQSALAQAAAHDDAW
ncbi:ATPase synthesis protein 25 [Penicillium maclennaniae]|uniref:ATPase synthesis protein 25 n=1 Tax=Penicillium maclennaniae TaxID=1343394 RepID=UPI00254269B3|nr:ATPase synthesis protein 25 [Penicillium maclennaniae]KAJ5677955.1 ATPase synthesis protein 25 [Penicillium maclennaniae]